MINALEIANIIHYTTWIDILRQKMQQEVKYEKPV